MSLNLLRSAQNTLRSTSVPSSSRRLYPRLFHTTLPKMVDSEVKKVPEVKEVDGVEAFNETLAKNNVVFVDWFARWCGPCKAIAPQVARWAEETPSIHFTKVDVDKIPELSQEYGIRAMPTFMIFKNGEKVDEFIGANPVPLHQLILKHKPEETAEEKPEESA